MAVANMTNEAKKLIAIQFLVGFVFWYGIEKTFVRDELGFGAIGISMVVTTYLIVTFALEVPSGILADKWGRKNVLITSILLFMAGCLVLGAATNMPVYLLGTALWGLYSVTLSGTLESITYDSLLNERKQALYQKVDALQGIAFMIGIFLSSTIAGFMGPEWGLRSTYFMTLVPLTVALVIAVSVKEPKIHKALDAKAFAHAKRAISLIARNSVLTRIAVLLGLVFLMINFLYEYSQYYYLQLFDDSVAIAAFLSGITGLFLALGYALASRVNRFELMLMAAGVIMAIAGAWQSSWAIILFCCIYPLAAITENRSQAALQHGLESDVRATSTSVVNFLSSCIIIPLSFGFAWIIEQYGAQAAYLYAGIMFIVIGSVFSLRKMSIRGGILQPVIGVDPNQKP